MAQSLWPTRDEAAHATGYDHTMVQRYVSPDQVSIEQEFDLVRGTWEFCAHFNVAPLHIVPVIRVVEGQPDLVPLRWGFGDADSATLPIEMLQCAAPAARKVSR